MELLLNFLGDEHWSVVGSVVWALGKLGDRASIDRLLVLLEQGGDLTRWRAAAALGGLGAHVPVGPLVAALDDKHEAVRETVVATLGKLGAHVPSEPLVAALGDSEKRVREAAIQSLHQSHPEALLAVVPEATAILQGQASGKVLGSLVQGVIAEAIGNLGYNAPALLEKLTQLLDWPYWEVRMKAAQALGKLRRNIPDAAIRRLLELRHDPQSRAVRVAANDALPEILSLQTGIEDD